MYKKIIGILSVIVIVAMIGFSGNISVANASDEITSNSDSRSTTQSTEEQNTPEAETTVNKPEKNEYPIDSVVIPDTIEPETGVLASDGFSNDQQSEENNQISDEQTVEVTPNSEESVVTSVSATYTDAQGNSKKVFKGAMFNSGEENTNQLKITVTLNPDRTIYSNGTTAYLRGFNVTPTFSRPSAVVTDDSLTFLLNKNNMYDFSVYGRDGEPYYQAIRHADLSDYDGTFPNYLLISSRNDTLQDYQLINAVFPYEELGDFGILKPQASNIQTHSADISVTYRLGNVSESEVAQDGISLGTNVGITFYASATLGDGGIAYYENCNYESPDYNAHHHITGNFSGFVRIHQDFIECFDANNAEIDTTSKTISGTLSGLLSGTKYDVSSDDSFFYLQRSEEECNAYNRYGYTEMYETCMKKPTEIYTHLQNELYSWLNVKLTDGSVVSLDPRFDPADYGTLHPTRNGGAFEITTKAATPLSNSDLSETNRGGVEGATDKVDAGSPFRIYINQLSDVCKQAVVDGDYCYFNAYVYSDPIKLESVYKTSFHAVKKEEGSGRYYIDTTIPKSITTGLHKIALYNSETDDLIGWTPINIKGLADTGFDSSALFFALYSMIIFVVGVNLVSRFAIKTMQ